MSSGARFFSGMTYHLRAFRWIQDHPSVRRRFLRTLFLCLSVGVFLPFAGFALLGAQVLKILALFPPDIGYQILGYLVTGLAFVGLFLAWGLFSFFFLRILFIPMMASLAEFSLRELKLFEPPQSLREQSRLFWKSFRTSGLKYFVLLPFFILLFLMSLIPFLQPVAMIAGLLVSSYDSVDYSLEVLGWDLNRRWRFFYTHLPELFGMSAVTLLFIGIPWIQVIMIPLTVVAGSLMVQEMLHPRGELRDTNKNS